MYQYPKRQAAYLGLLLLALCLVACGGTRSGDGPDYAAGSSDSVPAASGSQALPRPSEALRRSSFIGDDLRSRQGYNWDSSLPSCNTSGSIFMPSWDGNGAPSLATSAYAIYHFGDLAGHDGPPRIVLAFDTGSYPGLPAQEDVFIALANLQQDRWDWYPCASTDDYQSSHTFSCNFSQFAPYLTDQGQMLCLVMVQRSEQCDLSWVLAGANAEPDVYISTDLDPNSLLNIGPRLVHFNCEGSSYGSALAGYDFDWDGDAVFDLTNDPDGLAEHEFQPGSYRTVVRVTDLAGLTTSEAKEFLIIDPNNVAPSAMLEASTLGGTAPLGITFDASGSTDDKPLTKFEWDLNSDGHYEKQTTGPELETILAQHGPNVVTLRVTDSDLAQSTATAIIDVSEGWAQNKVAQAYPTDMCAVTCGSGLGRRPCLLWLDGGLQQLRFTRAGNSAGTDWPAAVEVLNLSAGAIEHMVVTENPVDKRPMVAFTLSVVDSGMQELHIMYASNDACTQWSQALKVWESKSFDEGLALSFQGNMPMLAFSTRDGGAGNRVDLHLLRGHDNLGSSWEQDVIVASDVDLWPSQMELLSNGGDLLLALSGTNSLGEWQSSQAQIWHTESGDPQSWSASPQIIPLAANDMSMALVNGQPALAIGGSSQHSPLRYLRSLDSLGSSWPSTAAQYGEGRESILYRFEGQTCVVYNDTLSNQISVVRAIDDAGSGWATPEPLALDTLFTDPLALTINLGKPYVFYHDPDNNEISCATWQF